MRLVVALLVLLYAIPLGFALTQTGLDVTVVRSAAVQEAFANGILQALLSTALAMALGLALAWLHQRKIKGGSILLAIHAVTFVLPVFVVVYGMYGLFGRTGIASGGHDWIASMGPLAALVLAHGYYNHGFAASQLHHAMALRPRRVEDAARLLGAKAWAVRLRVSLPLLMPSILSTALLVFLFSFTAFGTVLLLGQGHFATPEIIMYGTLRGLFPDEGKAAAIGVLQAILNGGLLWLALRTRRRFERQGLEDGSAPKGGPLATLGAWSFAALALAPVFLILAQGFRYDGSWSLAPWQSLLAHPRGFDGPHALGMSALYAGIAVAVAGLAAVMASRKAEGWLALPMAISPLLLGLGLQLAYGPAGLGLGASALVAIGHAAIVLPFIARLVLPASSQISARIPEAARLLGAPKIAVAWRIRAGILRAPLVGALLLGVALSLGELTLSLLMSDPGSAPLSVWVVRLEGGFDPLGRARAVALSGFLCLLSLVVLLPRLRKVSV